LTITDLPTFFAEFAVSVLLTGKSTNTQKTGFKFYAAQIAEKFQLADFADLLIADFK